MFRLIALLSLLWLADSPEPGEGVRLTLLDGGVRRGVRLVSLEGEKLRLLDDSGTAEEIAVPSVVSIVLPGATRNPPVADPSLADLLLRGGDMVRGTLLPAGAERIGLRSAVLGDLAFPVDEIAEVRFVRAFEEVEEKPSWSEAERDRDVFVYRNLDRLSGTFLEVSPGQLLVHGRIGERHPIAFENLLAVRFADVPAPPPPEGRRFTLLLADGGRVTAVQAALRAEVVTASTERGEELKFRLADLRALWQTGGRFRFLSDLPPDEERFVPWLGEAYAWDRPRVDRSVLDRPLAAGGQTFGKGLGVLSGTALTWRLDGSHTAFTARVALDDAAGPEGDVVFEVLLDGESKWRSDTLKRLRPGDEPLRIPPIPLGKAKTLTLRVDWVDDFVTDFADWIEPMLVK